MPDNPRQPEHHSDIPSSRSSSGTPGPHGSSYGGNYTPPPQHDKPTNKLKNILIGSIATIVTSTVVFLITQTLKKSEGGDTTKDKTIAAWNSYVGYENIYTNNIMSLTKGPAVSVDSLVADIKKESQKFQRDVSDLADDKSIDKDLRKVFSRRLDNERSSLPVLEKYYFNLKKLNMSVMTPKERVASLIDEMGRYNEHSKGMYERAINDIMGIADVLSKRYNQKFSMEDFLIVKLNPQFIKSNDSLLNVFRNIQFDSAGNVQTKPNIIIKEKDIIGSWNADGSVFTFQKDGKMSWIIGGGQKATGTWKIVNNQLRLDGSINTSSQKGFWLFDITEVSESSLFLVSAKDEEIFYSLVRIITQ